MAQLCDKPLRKPEVWLAEVLVECSAEASTCPKRRLDIDDGWVWSLLAEASLFDAHGIMWEAGGIADQPVDWWSHVHAVIAERATIKSEERAKEDAKETLREAVA